MTADSAADYSARLAASGLAGGAVAMAHVAKQCGFQNAIGLDIGGTSSDISIMHNGEIRVTQDWSVEPGYPIRFPSIDLITIGAGGGSIAWIDEGGSLRNGPKSAGANPGPACYLTGGVNPTNTDANLVLGRLGGSLIGGEMILNEAAARTAVITRIAKPLGMDLLDAAAAVIRVANANISNAVRLVSVQKGYDPRDFALVAFGGAGPLHAVAVARDLSIPTVIVPLHPGITSAMGCALVDIRHDMTRTLVVAANDDGFAQLNAAFAEVENQLRILLEAEGTNEADQEFRRYVTMRYVGQWRSLVIPSTRNLSAEDILGAFHREHQREYAYSQAGQPVEIFSFRVTGTGRLAKPTLPEIPFAKGRPSPFTKRLVYFDEATGAVETCLYHRGDLKAGQEIEGPGIIEQVDSTVVIPPGCRATVEAHGNLILNIRGA